MIGGETCLQTAALRAKLRSTPHTHNTTPTLKTPHTLSKQRLRTHARITKAANILALLRTYGLHCKASELIVKNKCKHKRSCQ